MKKLLLSIVAILLIAISLKADFGLFTGTLSTDAISNLTMSSVTFNATATLLQDDPDITTRGFCWSTSSNPTIALETKTVQNGTFRDGSFSANVNALNQSTLYYVRAYITNSDGTFYGNEVAFTTIPTLPEWGLIIFGSLIAFFAIRRIIKMV